MATVIIPTPLRKFTNNTAKLEVHADTIAKTVDELTVNFPGLKKHLLDDTGEIRSFVNIFVGNDDIRNLQQGETVVAPDAVISIVPAIAGGNRQSAIGNRQSAIGNNFRRRKGVNKSQSSRGHSRFTIHDSRFTIHDSRFTIHDSRFTDTIHH